MSLIRYQPHIDGLRAVAVLLVIFHHLGNWVGTRGGYIGVDVFFVISGYLITSIVKAEVEAGTFTFGGFYKRRIVRLAPAYFTVLLVVTIAALIWMLPAELLAYARSMAASSMFLANFHIWKEVGGYFGVDAHTVPLLHLWSLAVEEQFYLFWPMALLIAYRFISWRCLPWLMLALVVGGAVFSQWGVLRYPAGAYYLLPTRFFELGAGAMLVYLPRKEISRTLATVVSFIGIALITYAALVYTKESLFPGYAALVPVAGTALLLHWGEGTFVGRALSTPALTLVGKISYPAYLWHWPIIAFLHVDGIVLTIPMGLMVLVVTWVLSWLTFRWIERPARRFLTLRPRNVVVAGGGMPIALAIAAALLLVNLNGLPSRFPESLNRKSDALLSSAAKARGRCNEGPPTAPLPPGKCVLGRANGKVDFLLVGDSHANHMTGFFDELGKDAQLRGYDMTRSQTAFLPGVDLWTLREGKLDHHRNFVPRNRYVSDLLRREHYETVVLAGAYAGYYIDGILKFGNLGGRKAFEAGMRAAIEEASSAASVVIVVTSVPRVGVLYDCGLRVERFKKPLDCSFAAVTYFQATADLRAFFRELKHEFPNVVWVEPDMLTCDGNTCATEMDGVPLYKDFGHLNDIGSRLLGKKWISKFGNPLLKLGQDIGQRSIETR